MQSALGALLANSKSMRATKMLILASHAEMATIRTKLALSDVKRVPMNRKTASAAQRRTERSVNAEAASTSILTPLERIA